MRGTQNVTWNTSDNGSDLRFERLRVDGAQSYLIDHRGSCNLDASEASGEFARDFAPCPTGGPYGRAYGLDTTGLADGAHTVQACSQDYGQAVGLNGSGGESCDQRTVNVDNTPPSAPGGFSLATANPARYLDRFGASWTIPPDPGSPIAKVHYNIVNAAGTVVVPEQTVSATNPTKLEAIEGPKAPGDYRLRVWLEDAVGFTGPVATAKPTSYEMRAQVRETVGYPYLQGESAPLALRAVPGPAPRRRAHHRRCGAHRHPVKRGGKVRCARARHPGGRRSGRPGATGR